MKRLTALIVVTAACASSVFAQNALVKTTKGIDAQIRAYALKAAEEMPEENYSFKPVDSVRNFGAVVAHIADAQYEFCSPIVGDGAKGPDVEKTKTSKADIIAALKASYAYCDKAYAELTDASGAAMADFYGQKMPKLGILELNAAHTDEHYGNLVTYLRIKGLVPPSSK